MSREKKAPAPTAGGVRRRVDGRKPSVPPETAPRPRTAETFDLHGHTFTKGDQIVVKPSAPRHRDGFTARVISAHFTEAGEIDYVDVFGAPGSKAPCTRSLRPDRLAPLPQRRSRRTTNTEEN